MAVNIQGVPYQPHPQGSLIDALRSGFSAAGAAGQAAGQLAEGRNKPQQLAESLLASRLANQINTAKAKYAEQNEQAGLQLKQGQVGLLPYQRKLLEAQVLSAGTKSAYDKQKQQFLADVMKDSITGGKEPYNEPQAVEPQTQQSNMPKIPQGNYINKLKSAVSQQQPTEQPTEQLQSQQIQNTQPQITMSYPRASLAMKMLGLGEPKIIDIDGKKVAVTPFGNIEVGRGLNEFEKQTAKEEAKQLGKMGESYSKGLETQGTFDKLDEVVSNPDWDKMRQFPLTGTYELKAYALKGTKEQQDLVNRYMTYTGQIIKDAARDFKGQFRVGEQALLNSMKPSLSDTATGARAKLDALSTLNKMQLHRAEIAMDLIRQRIPMEKALKIANEQVKSDEVMHKLNAGLHESGASNKVKYYKNPENPTEILTEQEYKRRFGG